MELLIGAVAVWVYACITIAVMFAASRWISPESSKLRKAAAPLLVLVIALAIPSLDHMIGWLHFKSLCKDAGTKIHRIVEGVPGFRSDSADSDTASRYGYRFVEHGKRNERVTRYTAEGGGINEQRDVPSISQFSAALRPTQDAGMFTIKQDFAIVDESTNDILAVHAVFAYKGGWLVRAVLSGYGGIANKCPTQPLRSGQFITAVLRPIGRSH